MASTEKVPRGAKRRTTVQLEAELAQARAERDEALEYQAAISDVLKVIARPTSDLQPVLDTLLTAASQLSHSDSGGLWIREGEGYRYLSGYAADVSEADTEYWARVRQRRLVPGRDDSVTCRVALERGVVHVADILTIPAFAIPEAAASGRRTGLGVPLLRDGEVIGVIALTRKRVAPYSERQIELVRTFADQAVIAMENARLLSELQARTHDLEESLEYQTATSDVLSVISRSTADVQPVLDTVVETAARLCGAENASILIREGEVYRYASSSFSAAEPKYWATLRQRTIVPGRDNIAARAALERRVVHIEDVLADPDFSLPEAVAAGRRAALGVPLLRDSEPIGIITLTRNRVEPFTDRQIDLVRTFADQAVIAIENARLITETREALEQQTATAEVLGVINSSPGELAPVFDAILEKAHSLCGAAFGALITFDDASPRLAAERNLPAAWADFVRSPSYAGPDHPVVSRILRGEAAFQIEDLAEVARTSDHPMPRAGVELGGIRTLLIVPLRKGRTSLGFITAYRQEVRPFSDKQIALLENFAAQAVVAMENARLLGELQARTRDLEESLEYQTATSDVLNVISRSTADVQPVLETVADTAARLCTADSASIVIREGEVYRYVAGTHGTTAQSEYWAMLRQLTVIPGRDTLAGRVLLEGKTVHIEDISADPDYAHPEAVASGRRTWLGVPLLREGAVLGTINLSRKRVEPYTERQIELVRTFADQAVIAMENARLINETREALEQQTATAEVLQVINASPGHLAPVFDAMLEKAMRLCEASFGNLQTYDGEKFHIVAVRGPELPLSDWPNRGSTIERFVHGEDLVQISDISQDEAYRAGHPGRRALVDAGFRNLLGVALRKEQALLGALHIYRTEVRPFTDKQIALLQSFAAQAVIAIENARLLDELQARTRDLEESLEYQTATSDVLNVISRSTADVQPVLDTVAETAVRLCGADLASITMREGEVYRYVASSFSEADAEWWAALRQRTIVPGRDSMAGRVALEGRVEQIADVSAEPDYAVREAVTAGLRTTLGVPLLREGAVLGVIGLGRYRVEPFSERQIELVRTFADQAVIAMENARLLGELQARTADLEESLEYQTATSDVLNVISRSTADIQPVLDAVTETAARLCASDTATILMRTGDAYRPVTNYGDDDKFRAISLQLTIVPGRQSVAGRVALEGGVVHVADILADPDYAWPENVAAGRRTMLGVPLLRDSQPIGVIALSRKRVEPFTERQIELIRTFADQAVIAIENARLLDEIRQRQAELRVTFDNMGDAVVMFDEKLHLAAWNKNFQELLDLSDDFLAEPHDFEAFIRFLTARGEFGGDADPEAEMARLRPRFGDHYSFERTRPDGRVIEVRHNPMPDGGFVLIYSDITERKRSEEEVRAARDAAEAAYRDLQAAQASLVQAQKMAALGQLTAGIAHEIKNPLNFVNNFAGLSVELLDELKETAAPGIAALDEDTRAEIDETVEMLTGNLAKIAEHGARADNIVKSMLEHSRGVSGERRAVDLNALVEEALNLAYHGARAQDSSFNITLERDYAGDLRHVELAPQEMTRVLLNLIGNGFYATGKRAHDNGADYRPTLSVATRDTENGVEIRVRDNGTGIPADIRDKLFQPFFTTKPTGEGTGLGLSISFDIVTQQHGGTIEVMSEAGAYTEFTVRLPRNRHPAGASA
jgi:two-component system, NtrC family, sensor kinase